MKVLVPPQVGRRVPKRSWSFLVFRLGDDTALPEARVFAGALHSEVG